MSNWLRTIIIIACTTVASVHGQPTTAPADGKLDFGDEGLTVPPATEANGHTARTATLLGEAYRRRDPVESKRLQYIADLRLVARPEGAPYLADAVNDPSPAVRAEAARAAGAIPDAQPSLLGAVEKLLEDPDAAVRREAVLSAGGIARAQGRATSAIERGLGDRAREVVAAALQQAWTPQHAQLIADHFATLPKLLQPDAARALARMKVSSHAHAVVPLLSGDVVERAAATRALGELGDAAQQAAVIKMLADAHPTVRREAVIATAKLADAPTRQTRAIAMLNDADPTVREAAANALNPSPSAEALAALAKQLATDYAPLHDASQAALSHPADDAVRGATIRLATDMLGDADPRRREDASYILGRLRSGEAFERHLQLLQWDLAAPDKTDWALVGQVAESLGLIGDSRAAGRLMELVKLPTESLTRLPTEQQRLIGKAMGNALAAAGRIGHRPALDEAIEVLRRDPLSGTPAPLRTSASFVVGALGESGKVPEGVSFMEMYGSINETPQTKFEALKALGNLRYAPAAKALKTVSEAETSPDLRWIAHWSYERAARTTVPYTPPVIRREPPVAISDLPQ